MFPKAPDLLGMSLDDARNLIHTSNPELAVLVTEYRVRKYKNWGKAPIYNQRVIRQRFVNNCMLEVVLSDFIENP